LQSDTAATKKLSKVAQAEAILNEEC